MFSLTVSPLSYDSPVCSETRSRSDTFLILSPHSGYFLMFTSSYVSFVTCYISYVLCLTYVMVSYLSGLLSGYCYPLQICITLLYYLRTSHTLDHTFVTPLLSYIMYGVSGWWILLGLKRHCM
ncbi:hypothetical protein EX30DRAFT_390573, partial [Ascodesmis nigricans]